MLRALILVCSLWGFTTGLPKHFTYNSFQALPATSQQQLDNVLTPTRRDYQTASNQYATNTVNNGYSNGGTDVGQNYYNMPEQEGYGGGAGGGAAAAAATGAQDHQLMQPLMIIIVLLVAILLQLALPGLLASLYGIIGPKLPTLAFEPITVPVPDLAGRALIDNNLISWEKLNRLTKTVRKAIEVDECRSRIVCYSARYADGSNALLALLEQLPTEEYSSYVKIFKDSALRKADCNIYKCGSLGTKD